jgi:hypothetical protein
LQDRKGEQLGVGQLRDDPNRWPPRAQLRRCLQGIVDLDAMKERASAPVLRA